MSPEREQVTAIVVAQTVLARQLGILEAAVDRLLEADEPYEWPEEQFAQFNEALGAAGKELPEHENLRQVLRMAVTVVKPGEVLFFTVGDPNITPNQLRELQLVADWWLEQNAPEVKVLILPCGSMAAAQNSPD